MVPKSRRPWGTCAMPARTIASGRALVRSRPARVTVPAVSRTRPLRAPSKVDLPAPLAPIRATSSPSATSRSTPKRTGPAPKPAVRPRTARSGSATLQAGVTLAEVGLDHPAILEHGPRLAFGQDPAVV